MFKITSIKRIEAHLQSWHWSWAEENREQIDAYWLALHDKNPALYDGEVLLMCAGAVVDDSYHCSYFKTRFSRFIAWRDWGTPDPSVRNGFAMNALRSKDGAYLLGVMADHTSNAGKMYFPAGTPDLSDIVDDRVDLTGSAVRELYEETGFSEADITAGSEWTLVEGAAQVAYLRHCELNCSTGDALERFGLWHAAQTRPELARLHPVATRNDLNTETMHDYLLHWFGHVLD